MSDVPQGDGWWQASDGKFYPPEATPGPATPPPPPPPFDPGGAGSVAPGTVTGWPPQAQPVDDRKKSGCGRAALVVAAIGAALIILIAVVAAVGSGKDDNTSTGTSQRPTGTAPSGGTATTQAAGTSAPDPTCAYSGTDDMGDMQVELTFVNTLGTVDGLKVTYALFDGEGGTRFYTGTAGGLDAEQIMFPAVNEQFRLLAGTVDKLPPNIAPTTISCKVLAIERATDIGGFKRASDADACTVVGTDSSGNVQVELAVTSPYDETTKVQTWWALQGPGPVRFDTETDVTDLVGAGESFKIIPEYGTEKASWIADGQVTCTVVGFWNQGH